MAVTLREVAQAAGVSTAAVSKVLHGRGSSVRVSEERAEIIRAAAKRLNYRPNALARNLRSSRTHTVGLIFENFWNISGGPLYYLHLLDGVGSVFFQNHYRLTILPELAQDDILGSLSDGQLEGAIWCKLAQDEATLNALKETSIPIVAMSAPPAHAPEDVVYVSCDNDAGIGLAVAHLKSLGHRRVLFLSEWEERANPDRLARLAAFERAMAANGLEFKDEDIASWDWHFETFTPWWDSQPPQTAILCWSESAAGRILQRTAERGLRVPEHLSVVGFDSTQYCETTHPRLTAVSQPVFEMARAASEILLDRIRGERPNAFSLVFRCGLDVRDSTGPAPRVISQ